MTGGSLFDGIAGFPLAGARHGIEFVWASEIEPAPVSVSRRHFPNMKHLGDVTKINGAEIEPVDVITFGSPCQDLSIAGKREGIAGARSGLFGEAIRIIREMRIATDNRCPRFAVWENVPGAFSSNKGEDFRTVIEELAKTADKTVSIPKPPKGKWNTAGSVVGGQWSIAWRVLDAQYWGVPQRRKKIFLIADFRGQCAGEILFEPEGVSRNITEIGSAREDAAGSIEVGAGETSECIAFACSGFCNYTEAEVAATQRSVMHKQTDVDLIAIPFGPGSQHDTAHALRSQASKADKPSSTTYVVTAGFCQEQSAKTRGIGYEEERSPTLRAGVTPSVVHPTYAPQGSMVGRELKNGPQGDGINEEVSFTLDTTDRHAVAYQSAPTAYGNEENSEVANTLLAKANLSYRRDMDNLAVIAVDCRNLNENEELSGTLQSKTTGGYSLNYQNPVRIGYRVRRLTPTECERLQGFPDNWTLKGADGKGLSDTARYKALGNSVAIPCVEYVMAGIARCGGST